jgi:uncharacterized protein
MGKFLFLLLLGVAAWWVFRTLLRAQGKGQSGEGARPPPAEDMVRCATCGVHLPRSESLLRDGRLYCSEAHSRLPR